MISVLINAEGDWSVPESLLEEGLKRLLREEGYSDGEISLTFLGDSAIRAMNEEYLGKDQPTDVIAFSLHDAGDPPFGDVYVGYNQASRQAGGLGVPLEEELLRLAIHGTLHVLGHTHPEGEGREESPMYRLQEHHLARALSSTRD
ncbi:rRNA maturation RNase YbeY [Gemmatimonadota bacterium]